MKLSDIQLAILLYMIHFITKVTKEVMIVKVFHLIDLQKDGQIDEK